MVSCRSMRERERRGSGRERGLRVERERGREGWCYRDGI